MTNTELIAELQLIMGMCCGEHMYEELKKLVEKLGD